MSFLKKLTDDFKDLKASLEDKAPKEATPVTFSDHAPEQQPLSQSGQDAVSNPAALEQNSQRDSSNVATKVDDKALEAKRSLATRRTSSSPESPA